MANFALDKVWGTEACVAGFGTLGLASDKGLSDGDTPSSYNCVGQWFE